MLGVGPSKWTICCVWSPSVQLNTTTHKVLKQQTAADTLVLLCRLARLWMLEVSLSMPGGQG